MANKKFSDESKIQKIVDESWAKYQKANASKSVKKPAAKKKKK